jgi:hypothetical protein
MHETYKLDASEFTFLHVTPTFVDFQIPPETLAAYKVSEEGS